MGGEEKEQQAKREKDGDIAKQVVMDEKGAAEGGEWGTKMYQQQQQKEEEEEEGGGRKEVVDCSASRDCERQGKGETLGGSRKVEIEEEEEGEDDEEEQEEGDDVDILFGAFGGSVKTIAGEAQAPMVPTEEEKEQAPVAALRQEEQYMSSIDAEAVISLTNVRGGNTQPPTDNNFHTPLH
eukprot:evm.model.NODE_3239_length_31224_cov_31.538591.1